MLNQEETDETRTTFFRLMKELSGYDVEKLQRLDLGSEINFVNAKPIFEQIHFFAAFALDLPWTVIPVEHIQDFISLGGAIRLDFDSIRQFRLASANNPSGTVHSMIVNLRDHWKELYARMTPHMALQIGLNKEMEPIKKKADALFLDLKNTIGTMELKSNEMMQDFRLKSDAANVQIQKSLEQAANASKEAGITREARHFEALARSYLKIAFCWLIAAIGFGVVTYFYVANHLISVDTTSTPALLRAMIPRFAVLSILFTGLVFCIRNFTASAHNQIINRHRQAALATFKAFVEGTDDKDTKNQVLLQATKAIFGTQPSGYLKSESETPAVSQITEIVKGVAGKSDH